jgi:hypothetical protein
MRYRIVLLAGIGSLLLSFSPTTAEEVVLRPTEAAGIVGEVDGTFDPRVFITFDLSGIPEDAEIQYAGLGLANPANIQWEIPFVPVIAGALTRAWDPSSVSWDSPSSGQEWENPGGDWDPALTSYRVIVRSARAPLPLLVTDLVRSWFDGTVENHGVVVMFADTEELSEVVQYFNLRYLTPFLKVRYFSPLNYEISG